MILRRIFSIPFQGKGLDITALLLNFTSMEAVSFTVLEMESTYTSNMCLDYEIGHGIYQRKTTQFVSSIYDFESCYTASIFELNL